MGGSNVTLQPGFDIDAIPFGVVDVDRDGSIKSYRPFYDAMKRTGTDVIGQNFFSDVVPYPQMRRFHDRFWTFVAHAKTAVEPFEFVFQQRSGEHRVTMLFVRDEEHDGRVSIVVMKDGELA